MIRLQGVQKQSQEEIFARYGWWNSGNLLHAITAERCDYIESCVDRGFGREALRQQEVLEVGCGGGLIGVVRSRSALIPPKARCGRRAITHGAVVWGTTHISNRAMPSPCRTPMEASR